MVGESESSSVVVGALGTILKALGKHLDEIGTNVRIDLLQKEGGALGNSQDSEKDPRDLRLRDVAQLEKLPAQMKI